MRGTARERPRRGPIARISDQVTEQHADDRADDPSRIEHDAGADDDLRVVAASAVGRQRPRLVHHQLRTQQPRPPGPASAGATLTPIGPYRRFNRIAATTAAPTVPPSPRIETAANWADPANVVTDITIGATRPIAGAARTPNDTPKPNTRSRTARPSGTVGEREGAAGLVHRSADPTSGLLVGCPVDGCLLLRSRAHTGGGHGDARGAPEPGDYRVHVKPLRYRDRPHLAAWTDFEDRSITLQLPEPFFPFGEIVPYGAKRRTSAKGTRPRFIWLTEGITFRTTEEVLRFSYLHEWMHWWLKEVRGTASAAETTCDRFALWNFRRRDVTEDDARASLRRR